jgi:carbamoyltransferase
MGLAPYGVHRYMDAILEHLPDLKQDGSLWLDLSCFRFCQGWTTTSPKMHRHFARPPRAPESLLTQGDMDLPSRIQSLHATHEAHRASRCSVRQYATSP